MSYTSLLQSTATYWAPATPDGFGGITYASPTTFLCRWQDVTDNFQDTEGEEFISDAIVYTTSELADNGWLYLGTSAQGDPQDQAGAHRIRRREKTQTPNGSIVVYKNILG
jgi:hypothetical protein